jgi:hypothetical protein
MDEGEAVLRLTNGDQNIKVLAHMIYRMLLNAIRLSYSQMKLS